MNIIAIDPGLNGAWAVLTTTGEFVDAGELPRFEKLVDGFTLARTIKKHTPEMAVIERVGAMPKQGVSSTFTFGTAYGVCIGVVSCLEISLSFIHPGVWKKHFRLTGKPKDASRELAIRLFPQAAHMLNLKKHHGRADAILLARYALDTDAGRKFI